MSESADIVELNVWTPDGRIALRWALDHIAQALCEDRNAVWLPLETEHTV